MKPETRADIVAALGGRPADSVLSDMHPYATGDHFTDHMSVLVRSVHLFKIRINLCLNYGQHLARSALVFATKILRPGGHFVAKLTRGGEGVSLNGAWNVK